VAELTLFADQPGSSWLHRLDARMKLAMLAAGSAIGLQLGFSALGLMALSLVAVTVGRRRRLRVQLQELRWISLLLAFVFSARVLSTDGSTIFALMGLDITREGLQEGSLICLRLAIVFMLGSVIMATTRSTEVKAAVQWYLKPVPLVYAERVGTMLGLIVRFVPVIFEEVMRTSDAQRARAVENLRNPIQRAVKLGVPIMSRIIERSDQLALAMEARCYSEARTQPVLKATIKDWGIFMLCCSWLAALPAV